MKKNMNWYYCSKCSSIIKRKSDSKKIKSMCDQSGKDSILRKIESTDKLARKLRKKFLKKQFELSSFKPKQKLFLKIAFEQGVKVTFNGLSKTE